MSFRDIYLRTPKMFIFSCNLKKNFINKKKILPAKKKSSFVRAQSSSPAICNNRCTVFHIFLSCFLKRSHFKEQFLSLVKNLMAITKDIILQKPTHL